MAAVFANLAKEPNLENESIINGHWVGILNNYFPYIDHIIAPEYWTKIGSRRGDLAVLPINTGASKPPTPIFAFEGKRGKSVTPTDLDTAAAQLLGYLTDICPRGGRSFGVIAQGRFFSIYLYNGSFTMTAALNKDGNLVQVKSKDVIYDARKAEDAASAHKILEAISKDVTKPKTGKKGGSGTDMDVDSDGE